MATTIGHLKYPNNLDQSLNDAAADKVRKYRADYNNNPPNTVSFMSTITSTSTRLHGEFVRLLFLQTHRETDRFFHNFRSSGSVIHQWTIPLFSLNSSKTGLVWFSIRRHLYVLRLI